MKRRASLLLALIAILLLAIFLTREWQRSSSNGQRTGPTIQPSHPRTGGPTDTSPLSRSEPRGRSPGVQNNDTRPRLRAKKPGPDAIGNEYVLRFRNANDLQKFLGLARARG